MLSVIDFRTGDFGETATYARREFCWIPASKSHPEYDGRLGNLTIKLQMARTGWGRALELDTYAVDEQPPIPGLMGRVFHLANVTDPESDEVYEVVCGPQPKCTCKGFKCKAETDKHVDCLTHLIRSGIIDEFE